MYLDFGQGDFHNVSVHVTNAEVLNHVSCLLGVSEDFLQALTNKTSYVRKELYMSLPSAEQSDLPQRDHLVRDLYVIRFPFVVETANHEVTPSSTSVHSDRDA
ncbi:hypothetical protein BDP27DRAFT_1422908 [Rhodocollybia butyracea]|uniref:Uncharacterized protein n=1 Tax=Rhodocollybia butyracea TaxID=206335 RepID=A0A9P5U639_9AGAR|nr:hypothetical protein BDP27DRAFT_1422908 [Rhodocollybia butyracea]